MCQFCKDFKEKFIGSNLYDFNPVCSCGAKLKRTWDGKLERIFTCYSCKIRYIVSSIRSDIK